MKRNRITAETNWISANVSENIFPSSGHDTTIQLQTNLKPKLDKKKFLLIFVHNPEEEKKFLETGSKI